MTQHEVPADECPCCGQKLPDVQLKVDLERNVVSGYRTHATLRPNQARVLSELVKNAPRVVPHRALQIALIGEVTSGDKACAKMNKLICQLNKRLRDVQLPIVISNVKGKGWYVQLRPML